MGSTRARSVPAAQSTSKKLPAREVIGQPSPAPRRSCPKQAGKHHRGRSNWAAKSSTAAELPKTSRKISPRGSLMGSQVQHRGKAAQSKPENTTARKLLDSQVQHRGKAAQTKPESTTAREVNGQHKSQKRSGCPKYEQKTSREEINGQPSPAPRRSCPKQAGKYHREGS